MVVAGSVYSKSDRWNDWLVGFMMNCMFGKEEKSPAAGHQICICISRGRAEKLWKVSGGPGTKV